MLSFIKKLVLIMVSVLLVNSIEAQQKPYYSQYILNNYILNPALSGIENYTDVKLSNRSQWSDIPGAPKTTYFTIQGPINKSDYKTTPTSFQPQGPDLRGNTYDDDNTISSPHHGIGLMILNDKTGYISRFSTYASYAYHIPMSIKSKLALGVLAGFSNVTLDRTQIDWATLDPNDPAIGYSNGDLKKFVPEMGMGLWYYSPDYFIGASVLNLIPGRVKFVSEGKYGTYYRPNYFASAGYKIPVNDDLFAIPSVAFQWTSPEKTLLSGNIKFQYENKLWFGASYRYSDVLSGFSATAGINLFNAINFGYSYDFASDSRLGAYVGSTNEIVIGFLLGNKYKGDSCPKNLW